MILRINAVQTAADTSGRNILSIAENGRQLILINGYKILIADDEYWTREQIRHIINWEKYNLLFMEPAKDGEEVLKIMAEDCPDILITDINMPFINGVDLIRTVNKNYPNVVTVVLSGYDDFDYVRETMKHGAIDYLLKPISKVVMIDVLSGAMEKLAKKHYDEQEKKSLSVKLMESSSMMQDREFSTMLNKDLIANPPYIVTELNMDVTGYSLILIKIHNMSSISKKYQHNINKLSYHMKKIIKDIAKNQILIVFNHTSRVNEFIVISETDNKTLKAFCNKVLIEFEKITDSAVTVVIINHNYSLQSIHEAYVQALSLLVTRPFCKSSIVINESETTSFKLEEQFNSKISSEQEKSLEILVKSAGNQKILDTIINKIGLGRCSQNKWSYLEVRQTVRQIIDILGRQNERTTAAQLIDMQNLSDIADKTLELLDQDALIQIIVQIVDQLSDMAEVELNDTVADTVKNATKYIDKNYSEDLSLSGLAKKFSVESSYFSRVFHQQTGVTLISYITKQRMAKAKKYIVENDISLTEIAFLVGYDDYTYFSRLFKKSVGQSPREFKSTFKAAKTPKKN